MFQYSLLSNIMCNFTDAFQLQICCLSHALTLCDDTLPKSFSVKLRPDAFSFSSKSSFWFSSYFRSLFLSCHTRRPTSTQTHTHVAHNHAGRMRGQHGERPTERKRENPCLFTTTCFEYCFAILCQAGLLKSNSVSLIRKGEDGEWRGGIPTQEGELWERSWCSLSIISDSWNYGLHLPLIQD